MAREASERNQQLQTCYEAEMACYDDPSYFVFIDESHVDHKMSRRKNGWSPIGLPSMERSTFLLGTQHSILPALTTEGIIALDIFKGSVTKEKFITFLQESVVREHS